MAGTGRKEECRVNKHGHRQESKSLNCVSTPATLPVVTTGNTNSSC